MDNDDIQYERRESINTSRRATASVELPYGRRDSDIPNNKEVNVTSYINIIQSGIYIIIALGAAFTTYYKVLEEQTSLQNQLTNHIEITMLKERLKTREHDKELDVLRDHNIRIRALERLIYTTKRDQK